MFWGREPGLITDLIKETENRDRVPKKKELNQEK